MTNLHDNDELPFCGPDCLGCAIEALARDCWGDEGEGPLGSVYYRPGSRLELRTREELREDERDGALEAELGYELYLETRYSSEETDRELAAWADEWPNGYGRCNVVAGCRRGVYHPGAHVVDEERAAIVDALELAARNLS